jgi:hypothetical protein
MQPRQPQADLWVLTLEYDATFICLEDRIGSSSMVHEDGHHLSKVGHFRVAELLATEICCHFQNVLN